MSSELAKQTKKNDQGGWSFDERLERTKGVDLPEECKSKIPLISAYDFDYWRRNCWCYVDKKDLSYKDFDGIVDAAIKLVDPEMFTYNKEAAFSSALELAIWTAENSKFQSKIHPNTFREMLDRMSEVYGPKKASIDQRDQKKFAVVARLLKLAGELSSDRS